MCYKLFKAAGDKLDCPILMTSRWHPKSHLDVYVDFNKKRMIVCCGKCEKELAHVTARFRKERNAKV